MHKSLVSIDDEGGSIPPTAERTCLYWNPGLGPAIPRVRRGEYQRIREWNKGTS